MLLVINILLTYLNALHDQHSRPRAQSSRPSTFSGAVSQSLFDILGSINGPRGTCIAITARFGINGGVIDRSGAGPRKNKQRSMMDSPVTQPGGAENIDARTPAGEKKRWRCERKENLPACIADQK